MSTSYTENVKIATSITIKAGEKRKIPLDIEMFRPEWVYLFRQIAHETHPYIKIYPGFWSEDVQKHKFEIFIKNKSFFEIQIEKNHEIAELIKIKRY